MPKVKTSTKNEIKQELMGIFLLALSIFLFFCLWQESFDSEPSFSIGAIGNFMCYILNSLCGTGKILIPIILFIAGIGKLVKRLKIDYLAFCSIIVILLSILALLHLEQPIEAQTLASGWAGAGGGIIGALVSRFSVLLFGSGGSYIFLVVLIIASVVGILKKSLGDLVKQFFVWLRSFFVNTWEGLIDFLFEEYEEDEENKIKKRTKNKSDKNLHKPVIINHYENEKEEDEDEEPEIANIHTSPVIVKNDNFANQEVKQTDYSEFRLPPLDLLKSSPKVKSSRLNKDITDKIRTLEETLESFDVKAKVTQVSRGPSITRFEIQPPSGVKVSRIVNLADDIALSLATPQVRIEAPIPGKAAVGIEVPNEQIAMVTLREVLESGHFQDSSSKLTVALGKDIAGNPIVADLGKMPHLLIAGATGSGKSVCMNSLIASILYKAYPHEVKLIMIDPKVVELSTYNGVPHLLAPVVTDPKKAASALRWVVHEMESRYELFAGMGVKDIQRYNQALQKETSDEKPPQLPYIVVLIDELADLMMVAPADVEDAICRIAQMARAAGIHLVVATQRPSVDIITGVIKANIPSRIAFAVSSQTDSRTILDMGGAERLLGRGDMLFYPTGMAKPIRVQGVYVSDQEIELLVEYLKAQNKSVDYVESWDTEETETNNSSEEEEDALLAEATRLFIESGQASISLLQRRLRIGYTRAARIIDQLEDKGIVGSYEGSKPRAILMNWDEYYKEFGKDN
ncbi:MAG: DNA translocase FtsK [Clostridia bacterium]|jgi:S-DNA-T family DNA segregation ATPase FtsK/SpoIIIE|nr:DNA translocase FtsK [Clostridia bacterium]